MLANLEVSVLLTVTIGGVWKTEKSPLSLISFPGGLMAAWLIKGPL